MAETPKRARAPSHSLRASKQSPRFNPKPSLTPSTPQTSTPRRSTRRTSLNLDSETPRKAIDLVEKLIEDPLKKAPKNVRNGEGSLDATTPRRSIDRPEERHDDPIRGKRNRKAGGIPKTPDVKTVSSAKKDEQKRARKEEKDLRDVEVSFSPVSPEQPESRKRKRDNERAVVTRAMASKGKNLEKKKSGGSVPKKRVHYKKVVYDGGEFEVGDDVYVRRREDASSDDEDPEVEECRVCFKSGRAVMIECDDCLGGFHLKCLKPPLKKVPEGDWICGFCEARKTGKEVQLPVPPEGKKLARTMREKLLSSDLWAARIERYFCYP